MQSIPARKTRSTIGKISSLFWNSKLTVGFRHLAVCLSARVCDAQRSQRWFNMYVCRLLSSLFSVYTSSLNCDYLPANFLIILNSYVEFRRFNNCFNVTICSISTEEWNKWILMRYYCKDIHATFTLTLFFEKSRFTIHSPFFICEFFKNTSSINTGGS